MGMAVFNKILFTQTGNKPDLTNGP